MVNYNSRKNYNSGNKYNGAKTDKMEVTPIIDLIYDERGNYYTCIRNSGDKLVLLNAYVNKAYSRIFAPDDKSYEHKFIGNMITDLLTNHLERLNKNNTPGKLYSLNKVKEYYEIEFKDTAEYTQKTLSEQNG